MRNVFKKWYLSMFIVPIVLTYLTDYIKLPIIFENWEYSIITSFTILTAILFIEIRILSNRLKVLNEKPRKADIIIIRNLLETLNIDKFHQEVVRQDSWNGYYRENIHRILDFQEKAKLIGYKTSNEKVNNLIGNFLSKLDEFTNYSSKRVYGHGDWLIPFKDNPEINPHEKIRKETEHMNILTANCFVELEILMVYLRRKEYV